MFPPLSLPSSGQHLTVKGTISVHYTLWDPICLHNVRKYIYKNYLIFDDFYKYFSANHVNI